MARRLWEGNQALAEAAVRGGVEAFFGYPITPQTELLEYMAARMPELGRVFLQAESEVASINMVYGAACGGARAMTSSSSPGISLMQEGLSYIAASEVPAVLVDIMRGGPGLGNIQPSQSRLLPDDALGRTRGLSSSRPGPGNDPGSGQYHVGGVSAGRKIPHHRHRGRRWLAGADDGAGRNAAHAAGPHRRGARRMGCARRTGPGPRTSSRSLFLKETELEASEPAPASQAAADRAERAALGRSVDGGRRVPAWWPTARSAVPARPSCERRAPRGIKAGLFRPISLWPFPSPAWPSWPARCGPCWWWR